MPNYCYNNLIVKGDNENIIKFMNETITNGEFDFNKIIPQPTKPEECPNEFILKNGETENLYLEPGMEWFNWYHWNINFWGTKWNSCESQIEVDKNILKISFETAWTPALPIIREIIKKYGHELEFYYEYEEEGMDYSGRVEINEEGDYELYEY